MTVDVSWVNPDITSPYTANLDWVGAGHVPPVQPVATDGTWQCPA